MTRSQHRPELDGLRALAVVAVVCFHTFTAPGTHGPYPGYVGIGARGVDLFFVLSGFCLSWPYAPEGMRDVRQMLAFFKRRLTRIVPTCWVAIALFGALAFVPFGLPVAGSAHVALREQFADLVRDASFVPTMLPYHDPVLWTLGFEMRWYFLFPVVLIAFFRSKWLFAAIAIGAYALNRAVLLPDAGILPCFMLGIVAAAIAKRVDRATPFAPVLALLVLAVAVIEQCASPTVDHTDPIWQLACFAIVVAVATEPHVRRAFSTKPLVAIGVASYSIYLIHLPILGSLAWAGVPPVLAAVVSVAAGIAFWAIVERRLCSREARREIDRLFDLRGLVRAFQRRAANS